MMELRNQSQLDSYRWTMLGITTLCLFVYSWNFYFPAPVLSLIIDDLGLSYAQAGSLMSFFSLPGIVVSIPAGLIGDRYGPKKIGIISLLLTVVGAATAIFSGDFIILVIGRVLQGVGTFTLGVISAQLVGQWFSGKEMGLAMGVYNAAMPLGIVIWFNIISLLGIGRAWQQYLLVGLLMNLVMLALFILLSRERDERRLGEREYGVFTVFSSIKQAGLPIWLVGAAWLWFNACVVSFLTFAPDFFIERGYGEGMASMVGSSVMWLSVPLSPLVGKVIDWVNRKSVFIGGAGMAMAVMIFVIPLLSSGHLAALVITGLALSFIPTGVYAILPDVVRSRELGLGFGIISTCMNVAIVVGPLLVGYIRDVSGSYLPTFVLMASFAALIVPTVVLLERRRAVLARAY